MKDSTNEALRFALKLINLRDRTEWELIQKLKTRGFSDKVIGQTIERLKELSLVDDRRAAEALINYAVQVRGLGSRGLRRFCHERGLDEVVLEGLIPAEEDEQRAEALVLKRLPSMKGLDRGKAYRRLYGYLYRRGYPSEVIVKVLRRHLGVEV